MMSPGTLLAICMHVAQRLNLGDLDGYVFACKSCSVVTAKLSNDDGERIGSGPSSSPRSLSLPRISSQKKLPNLSRFGCMTLKS